MSLPPMPPGGGPVGGSGRRWIIVGVVLAAVAALVVGLLVWQTRSGDGGGSADDGVDRTVGLLTEKDPVCDDWIRYADELAAQTKAWSEIDRTISAARWTPQQRAVVERAADSMTAAANRFESILSKAKNIVLRELIAQSIVYWRKFVDRIPSYQPDDALLAGVASNFSGATTFMCTAAAILAAKGVVVESTVSTTMEPGKLQPFIAAPERSCSEMTTLLDRQDKVLRGWAAGDPSVPASQWTEDERRQNEAAIVVLEDDAREARSIVKSAENPVFSDLVHTYASYMEAYAKLIPRYEPDDDQLWRVATFLGGGLGAACEAAL